MSFVCLPVSFARQTIFWHLRNGKDKHCQPKQLRDQQPTNQDSHSRSNLALWISRFYHLAPLWESIGVPIELMYGSNPFPKLWTAFYTTIYSNNQQPYYPNHSVLRLARLPRIFLIANNFSWIMMLQQFWQAMQTIPNKTYRIAHIWYFCQVMSLLQRSNILLCRVFSNSLDEGARV